VFTNLLTNAYRYGGEHIRIESALFNDEVVLTVSDDGPGVPGDLIPHIFQPLTRGRDSRGLGSGLGLAIVQRLVHAFGGKIICEPGQQHGARFTVRLRQAA
jgi:signal transduction histidine kinase